MEPYGEHDLTDLFFDILEKSYTTFKYDRMYLPSKKYKGISYLVHTKRFRTDVVGDDFQPISNGQVQKELFRKLNVEHLIKECNEVFVGGFIGIYRVFSYKYAMEHVLMMRYSYFEPPIKCKKNNDTLS